jgi:type IV secretion system protein VirB8
MRRDPQLAAYFQEAATWDADRGRQAERRARTAWIVAGASITCTVATVIALMLLTPLKEVEPFLVRVDSRTGIVDVVPPYDAKGTIDETITRYLLTHYVATCERFNWSTAESDYEECAAFHGAQRNQQWAASWAKANPESPLNRYKDGTAVRVDVQAVTFFTRGTGIQDLAQVRYMKGVRRGNGPDEQRSHWIATVQYAYAAPAKDPRKRQWNPLGLRIVEFRSEAEALSDAQTSSIDGRAEPVEPVGGEQ